MESNRWSTGLLMMFYLPAESIPAGSAPSKEAPRQRSLANGSLALEFSRDPRGRTFLSRQYAAYPFHICRTQYLDARSELATVYIQSCSGGLYENDRLQIEVAAQPLT